MPDFAPLDASTLALHADDQVESAPDIAPSIHLSTTFAADNPEGWVYSRNDHPTRRRLETVLGALEGGHAIVYASGLAAFNALLHHLRPKRVAIGRGYHGTHQLLAHWQSLGVQKIPLETAFEKGDLVWLETPINPTCEIQDIAAFVRAAHAVEAHVAVDSTFATPILQKPLALEADVVMHSSTKFLSGHSDALGGVLVVPGAEQAAQLRRERSVQGGVLGTLETWLTLRSLRTLALRVERQSASAAVLARWLVPRATRVWHPSLPDHPGYEIAQRQMSAAGGVLAFELNTEEQAKGLPRHLRLIRDATSLGGVESLIEWRRRHDAQAPPALLRLAVGLESVSDLMLDLERGFAALR